PLGGLGEFGMNMLALTWGETTIVVDAGVMFPDPELLGVDRIIPDLAYLQQKGRAAALVLTHGHEDHIGAVPHLLPYVAGPVYATPLTLALIEPKLQEHGIDGAHALLAVRPRDRVTVGPFSIEFIRAAGRLVVAAFASSIYRMQILVDLAAQFDRKVAFVGRGMIENSQIAQRLGYLRVPTGCQIRDTEVPAYPAQDVLCLATGSQGEPMSALARIAIDDHRHVKVGAGDTVVRSARSIPGNEKAIGRVINHLSRRGADVIYEGIKHVHVSGHGSEEE